MLGAFVRNAKDGALAASMKAMINEKLGHYGEVQDCSIDTAASSIELVALLKGETRAITATVKRYELEQQGGERFIVLKEFSSSREWLGILLNRFFSGKRYKLPGAVAALL